MGYTIEDEIWEHQEMLAADLGHLKGELERGDQTNAHQRLDTIIDTQRTIKDLTK